MERAEESFRARRFLRPGRRLTLALVTVVLALASLLVYAKATRKGGPYALADDCPRGALVYAQAADLPELLRLWDTSQLKERYLASTNFEQFANGHVGLKLAARAAEFGDALDFAPDAQALAEVADKSAALAVYDIGRMELVFVAPVGEEKVLAARFFQHADGFEQTELPDGTVYYSRDVEADRGRQKQKVLFAYARGRFVLATAEPLMLRTLANLNGRSRADRLSDEPSFKTLSRALAPHLASVWVDQSRLGGDYYFKHYWAMSDASALKGIRAGLFDFETREGVWLERREFLLADGQSRGARLAPRDVRELKNSIPAEAAYFRLSALPERTAAASSLVTGTFLDRAPDEGGRAGGSGRLHESFDPADSRETDHSWSNDYRYLNDDYDQTIDDSQDSEGEGVGGSGGGTADDFVARLGSVLGRARPALGASAESPVVRDGPLFVEFRRLAILRLEEPGRLDARAFEEAVGALAAGHLTAAGTGARLVWSDAGEGRRRRRELELPMLGWRLCYALRGRDLFVSNDDAFLDAALKGEGAEAATRAEGGEGFDDLTVIRLDRRAEAFDKVFSTLDEKRARAQRSGDGAEAGGEGDATGDFFNGNVASLLDTASEVSRVEIRRRSAPGRLHEEVELLTSGAGRASPAGR